MGCGASRLDEQGGVIPVKARPLLFLRFEEFKRRRHPHQQAFYKDSGSSKKELLLLDDNDNVCNSVKQPHDPPKKESSSLTDVDIGSCITSEGSKGGSPERDGGNGGDQKKDKEEMKSVENDKGTDQARDHERGRIIDKPLQDDHHRVHETSKKVGDYNYNMDGDRVKIEDTDHEDDGGDEDDEDDDDDDDDDGRMLGRHDDDLAFPGSPSFRVYFTDNIKGPDNNKDEDVADDDDHLTEKAPIKKDDPKPLKQPQQVGVKQEVKKEKKRRSFKKAGRHAKNLLNVRACMSSPHHSNPDRTHLLTAKPHA